MPRGLPGPVTNVPRPVSLKKRQRKANKGSFTKERPGPGRPRGVPNKFTGELKEAILAGVNGSNKQGVAGFVLDLSLDTPTSAAALLGRLIPVSMVGTLDGTILVRHVDETAPDRPEASARQSTDD
jgi:hypothetical protein